MHYNCTPVRFMLKPSLIWFVSRYGFVTFENQEDADRIIKKEARYCDVHLSKAFIITDELNVFGSLLHFESVLRKMRDFFYSAIPPKSL